MSLAESCVDGIIYFPKYLQRRGARVRGKKNLQRSKVVARARKIDRRIILYEVLYIPDSTMSDVEDQKNKQTRTRWRP
eukprot:6213455-Pleurochrysis_carterae.AAC.2